MTDEVQKSSFDINVAVDLLPVLMMLVKALLEIIKVYKEKKDTVTDEERAELKKLINLTQTIF